MSAPRPSFSEFAEEWYQRLAMFHERYLNGRLETDESLGWPLLIQLGTLANQWADVERLLRDSDEGPGWTKLFDIDASTGEQLDWISQVPGVVLPPALDDETKRTWIRTTPAFRRGSIGAIDAAARQRLTGTQTVLINERVGGDENVIGVLVFADETPDVDQTQRDIEEQLPWWLTLEFVPISQWDYYVMRAAFDDYVDIRAHYADYAHLKLNDPPAV